MREDITGNLTAVESFMGMIVRRHMGKYRKMLLLSVKIGIGTCAAIYIAQLMNLEYPVSIGTVTLLTLMETKWETLKLSVNRLITLFMTLVLSWLIFWHVHSIPIAYGMVLTMVVLLAEYFGWRSTVSVNALVVSHLIMIDDFSVEAIRNEFWLVMIGIVIAIILNLFNLNLTHKRQIVANMRYTEKQLRMIMEELAGYLHRQEMSRDVWDDICDLEKRIDEFIRDAEEYNQNNFQSHPEYYINYFKMRDEQCRMLNNLHYEMKRIRSMPKQAAVVAEYLQYLTDYVTETNIPDPQIEKLKGIFADMRKEELPGTMEEFESRAMLFHILMDIEDFLFCNARFVETMDVMRWKRHRKNERGNR